MKIIFCGSGWLPIVDHIRERLGPGDTIHIWDRAIPLTEAVADADVILPSNQTIGADAIAAASRLRLIQQPAAGIDVVDLAAATAAGVPVCNAPGANHVAVAEAALFLLLGLARRYPAARNAFARAELGVPLGIELCGKTLGIVGFGRTGRALAERAEPLGMVVRSVRSTNTRAELHAMLGTSDAVSLHLPLTDATRDLFDDAAFAALRPGALLINCARGPIVNRTALESALDTGKLGGVGLDVYWQEPWAPDDPLFARDDVMVMPHTGGSTRASFARIADIVAANIRSIQAGDELSHRIA